MKNLVVCCDGTWKSADDKDVSNIEKIARAIETTPKDLPVQIVYYAAGVGTGATRFERLAGGAFGLGLDAAIVGAYRFLSLNYEKEDHVFVFGFSRGAYTARSLVGMIDAIGLLTPDGLVKNRLSEVMSLYRDRPAAGEEPTAEWSARRAEFAADCYDQNDVIVRFLGVFDTVGTLGVPGLTRRKYRFHNVSLTPQVATARHALAIHERRRAFAPAMWTENKTATPDVKQIWFDGVHSDVGGGYPDAELANRSLRWMVAEARAAGLAFADSRLVTEPQDVKLHTTLKGPYRVLNALSAMVDSLTPAKRFGSRFQRGWRVLERGAGTYQDADVAVDLAGEVYRRWVVEEGGSLPVAGVKWWIDGVGGERFQSVAAAMVTPTAAEPGDRTIV